MGRSRRTRTAIAGDREAASLAATLGEEIREGRLGRRMRLVDLGPKVGLSPQRLAEVERGLGATLPLRTWVRLGLAIDRPLAVGFTKPSTTRLVDAGHLELQEWALRTAREHGWKSGLEIPTRASDPAHSIDVLVRAADRLLLLECWNTIRDFGAAVRSTQRKIVEAEALAVALGARSVHACWLVRPTAANRDLAGRCPEPIRAHFQGSRASVHALQGGGLPPTTLGFVWLDPRVGLSALRIRS